MIMLRGNVRGEHIRPLSVDGAYRVIDTAQDATVSDLTIDGVQAKVTRDCIRVRGDSVTIRNVHCAMIGPPKSSMRFLPEGLHIRGGSDVRVENSSFSGFQTALEPSKYWNGDGVTAERGITKLSFRNVQSDNNSDAGFDIKSPVEMTGVSASGNCRDYRFWSDATVGTMQVGQTIWRGGISSCAGIWIQGSDQPPGPTVQIRNLVVSTPTPITIILVDGDYATIKVDRCSISAPAGSTMVVARRGLARIDLDSTCRVR
jgi:hypothetical protein